METRKRCAVHFLSFMSYMSIVNNSSSLESNKNKITTSSMESYKSSPCKIMLVSKEKVSMKCNEVKENNIICWFTVICRWQFYFIFLSKWEDYTPDLISFRLSACGCYTFSPTLTNHVWAGQLTFKSKYD